MKTKLAHRVLGKFGIRSCEAHDFLKYIYLTRQVPWNA